MTAHSHAEVLAARKSKASQRVRKARVFALVLMLVGVGVMVYPYVCQRAFQSDADSRITEFDHLADNMRTDTAPKWRELLDAMRVYNRELDETGQEGLSDPFAYEQPSFVLSDWGLPDGVIGYIDIPKIDVHLPIYLGATEENMSLGAVHLSHTSLPIGAEGRVSTNSVIAAHRGFWRAAMFRAIDVLEPGDEVIITNLWDTLVYRVVETKVINPSDVDQVLIQPGRDLVTLISCHPWPTDRERYVVYCERVK